MSDYIRKDDVLALLEKYRMETYSVVTTAKNAVKGMPTEDVVPTAEVAREIFSKLEEEIEAALESNYKVYEKYLNAQDSPTLLRVGGKIDALRGIYCFIEDLKRNTE